MSARGAEAARRAACASCLRRSWLLAELSGPLDCSCRSDGRLLDLLALGDEQLLGALGGRRRSELRMRYARFQASELARADAVAELCEHDPRYPRGLLALGAAPTLFTSGSVERLRLAMERPAAAIVGSTRATDYGMEIAATLARGLAASGVTVVCELSDGIARAVQAGALDADGSIVAVLGGGVDVPAPAHSRSLLAAIERRGVAVSELPCGARRRRWAVAAAARIVAGLAAVTVVVEAEDSARELACARVAKQLGRTVAAVPGRVSSRASAGTNALLRDGAQLVRGAADVLDLLYDVGRPRPAVDEHAPLEPRLRGVLEEVGAGIDTPQKLICTCSDPGELLQALSALELLGLLARGDGGRYVLCHALDAPDVR